jgi:Fe-S oxidoreductase
MTARLDWSAWPGAGGGFQGAVEMCNNNGACRALAGGVMCPSYRVTREERDVTRGRANTLRLAITGQLGADALTSDEMAETLKLCVSCKACRRECPTGVDMARMKIEVLAARAEKFGLSLHDRLVGHLPRYAPYAARLSWLLNLRDVLPGAAKLSEAIAGLSARRSLPRWRADWFRDDASWPGLSRPSTPSPQGAKDVDARIRGHDDGRDVVLFADTFNRYFERENLDAALAVLAAAGYAVHLATPADGSARPLCCGRTFLSIGQVDEARKEAERVLAALDPFVARGVPVVGLEPSCILGFRDEIPAIMKDERAQRLAAQAMTFEEFLAREAKAGRLDLPLAPIAARALVHGHCHQKSFDVLAPVEAVLRLVPGLAVETIESSCCGMAGSFGYAAATIDVSLAMGELSLLPAVRKAPGDAIVVADGTSCRHQIHDGTGRAALHVARVLQQSLANAQTAGRT